MLLEVAAMFPPLFAKVTVIVTESPGLPVASPTLMAGPETGDVGVTVAASPEVGVRVAATSDVLVGVADATSSTVGVKVGSSGGVGDSEGTVVLVSVADGLTAT